MVVIRTIKNRNAVSGKVSEENAVLDGKCSVKFRFSDLKNQAVRFANVLIGRRWTKCTSKCIFA